MQRKNLKEIESEIENFWEENKIYEKFKVLNENSEKKFYFCQGPPFTSGEAHLGHAWNHVIKDSVIRFKSANNYNVFKRAGWDMHGLPIEVKVEQKFNLKSKKDIENFGVDRFIEECKNFAIKNADAMTKQLKKLSVYLDWEDAYLTIDKNYISGVWKGIKKAYEKNLLYEKEKITHWCPRCSTVMAGYEVAEGYKEITDTAIYVKAKLSENFKINSKIYENVSILIWTTTPWTLPANVAIAVNPDIDYVLIEYESEDNKEKIICALSALNRIFGNKKTEKKDKKKKHYKDAVLSESKEEESSEKEIIESINEEEEIKNEFKILEKFKGEILDGIKYESILNIPLQREISEYHKIVLAKELVSEDEGSGAVHIAPGHGEEDAKVGEKYSLPDPAPVDEEGKFTIEPYKGIFVFDSNEIIIEELIKEGKILKKEKILHTYPHCWRCKTKLILRKTKQWFIAVSKIRDELLNINDKILWVPEFIGHGKDKDGNKTRNSRFENWLKEASDWCISRQRYWNTPLPIWKCECNNIEVIGSLEELEERSGVKINDLHKNTVDKISFKCKCGKIMHRVSDVMDVWLDSGSASYTNLYTSKYKENFFDLYPADFITEGSDQTRGWFYSLLVMGAIMFDDIAYKAVLYHGFTLDEKGVKMSKSVGNVVDPIEVIKKYSVDAFRMYLLSVVPWEDLKFSEKNLQAIEKNLNVLLNVFYFLKTYTELDNYRYNDREILKFFNSTSIENKIMISLTNLLIKNVYENFEKYYIHQAVSNIIDFIDDLSRYYVKIIRDKVWIEKEDKEKIDVYFTLCYALTNFSKVSASIIPHISEYIYKNIVGNRSVCLESFPSYNENLIDKNLIEKFEILKGIVSAALSAREKGKIKLRWPIKKIKVNLSKFVNLKDVEEIILKLTNSEEISYEKEKEIIKVKPNFATIGKKFRDKAKDVANLINSINSFSDEEKEKIANELENGKILLNGFEIYSEDVKIERELPPGEIGEKFDKGNVIISTEIDENLFKKAMSKEIIRRIQTMRKDLNLKELDVVNCFVECDDEFRKYIEENLDFIEHETRTKIEIKKIENPEIYIKEWEIVEWKVRIGIER